MSVKEHPADPLGPGPEVAQARPKKTPFAQPATLTAALALIAALYFAREILIPITLAVIFSFLVAPLVRLLQRLRLNQGLAVMVSVVVPLCVVVAIAGVVGTQIAELAQGLPQYRETIDAKVQSIQELSQGNLFQFLGRAGQVIERVTSGQSPTAPPSPPPTAAPVAPARGHAQAVVVPPVVTPAPAPEAHGPPLQLVGHFLSALLGPLATAFIVFIVSIFMLLERASVRDRFIKLMGSNDSARTTIALDDTAARLSRYFLSQLGVNTAVGLVIGSGLAALGAPSPVLWGVLAGLLRFIPYIGVWIAAALAALLGAAIDPGWSMVLWILILFGVTELIAGQFVEPLLYGHTTGLSPLSVVVSAIFWSWLWGGVGLILSTPLTLCLVVLGRYVERLRFLEILLGEKPQVTPAQHLYENLGEYDVAAALRHAEAFVQKGSATDYFDQVLVPGFRLLSEELSGHSHDAERITATRDTAVELISELKAHLAADPQVIANAAKPHQRRIWLIAARAPLDDVLALAIGSLFEVQGFQVAILGPTDGPGELAENLDPQSVLVCVLSLLPVRGASALQLTARGVRQKYQDVHLTCGIFAHEEMQSRHADRHGMTRLASVRELSRMLHRKLAVATQQE